MTVNKITSPPSQKGVIDKINEVIDNLGGGGIATDVQINGTSITSSNVANIITESAYNASSNKIATMADMPSLSGYLQNSESGTHTLGILSNPNSNNYSGSVAIGVGSRLNSGSGVAVGYEATVNDTYATALGYRAKAGYSAIQLGYGTNNTNSTFNVGFIRGTDNQSHNWQLLDGTTGLIPYQRINSLTETRNSGQLKFWTGTKAQYDAITTKDANTLYNITDDTDVTLALLELLYPVGSIYIGTMATCPLATLGIGTWQLVATDRVLQGAGTRGSVGTTVNESLPPIGNLNTSATEASGYGLTKTSGFANRVMISAQYSWAPGIYNGTHVQPDAYLVNIWERTA